MLKADVQAAVLAKWRALPKEERQTDSQKVIFATKMANEFRFRAKADPYQVIMGWIQSDMSRNRGLYL